MLSSLYSLHIRQFFYLIIIIKKGSSFSTKHSAPILELMQKKWFIKKTYSQQCFRLQARAGSSGEIAGW